MIDGSNGQIVGSIKFDFYIRNISLSSDRRVLYLQKKEYPYNDFVEVDINSRTIIYKGQNSSLYHTPDGRYLVSTSQGLRLFKASTHEIVYEDTITVIGRPTFDSRNSVFYVAVKDNRILVFDYARTRIIKFLYALTHKKFRTVFDLVFSDIDGRLYFSAYDSLYASYLGNLNTNSDRIITSEKLDPPWVEGFLYSSPVTQKIHLLAACYCQVIDKGAPYKLFSFLQTTQTIISELEIWNVYFGPFAMYVLEGGRKAYIKTLGGSLISIIDLEHNKIVGYISLMGR